jgi:hypothetical protein
MRLEKEEERQLRVEDREPRVEEETESGVLAPRVVHSPASEREERRGDD